jgi:hypothetical protein
LAYVNRERVYLRDPLAKVYKTRGTSLQSKSAASTSLLKKMLPDTRPAVQSNSKPTVVTDESYGVVTEHMQGSNPRSTQSGVDPGLSGLQNGVSGVLQSGQSVMSLGNKSNPLQSELASLLADDRKNGRQSGVQVFVNLAGDVLLEQDAQPGAYRILLQSWNKSAGTPQHLACLRWLVCLTDAAHAPTEPLDWVGNSGRGKGKYDPHLTKAAHSVSFLDGTGATMRIDLR